MTVARAFSAVVALAFVAVDVPLPTAAGADEPSPFVFIDAAERAGLHFIHESGAAGAFRLPEIMGSGAALLDCDGDGDLDVFLLQGHPDARTTSALFRNDLHDGTLGFTNITTDAGLAVRGWGMGVAVGDYDNDGRPDLYVTAFGANHLFRNEGGCRFTDVTAAAGVDDDRWSASAAFVDYDRDGHLDLFVTAYLDFNEQVNPPCHDPAGHRDYCLPAEFRALPSRLFRNDGRGRFADVTASSGIGSAVGRGLGVAVLDADGDGWPDLFVANDGTADHLWMNRRDGTFIEEGLLAGVAYDANGRARAGMGVAVADVDADGHEDILVTNLVGEGATLFLHDGRGRFVDATARQGLVAPTVPFTGFGVGWFDANADGRLDLFIANGAVAIVDALRGRPFPYQQRNVLLRQSDVGGFGEPSRDAASAMALREVSRGAAFGDVDNDGDVDIVVTNNNGPVRLLLNETRRAGAWLSVELDGVVGPRDAQGALLRIHRQGATSVVRRVHTAGSYLSAGDHRVHVGLGASPRIDAVVVEWGPEEHETWPAPILNRRITLRRGSGRPVPTPDVLTPKEQKDNP